MVGEGGREGWWGREGARGWWGRVGKSKGREVGSDDARQAESVSGGREGGLMKERARKGRDKAWTAGGRKRAEEGLGEEWMGSKGGKLQGRYPEEGIGQHTVYSQTIPQRGPCH